MSSNERRRTWNLMSLVYAQYYLCRNFVAWWKNMSVKIIQRHSLFLPFIIPVKENVLAYLNTKHMSWNIESQKQMETYTFRSFQAYISCYIFNKFNSYIALRLHILLHPFPSACKTTAFPPLPPLPLLPLPSSLTPRFDVSYNDSFKVIFTSKQQAKVYGC